MLDGSLLQSLGFINQDQTTHLADFIEAQMSQNSVLALFCVNSQTSF